MINEIWKDVVGYEGIYCVSTLGRVKKLPYLSKDRVGNSLLKQERILKATKHIKGYMKTRLFVNKDNFKSFQVHRLVAFAFLGRPPEGFDQVNHKNGVKHDNRIENLEWCNNSLNQLHSNANGFRVHKKRGDHKWAKIVLDTSTGIFYDSVKSAWEASSAKCRYDKFAHEVKDNKLKYILA